MSAVNSPVDIANWALDLLSEAEIESLTQQSRPAQACNRQWPKTSTVVLASCIWRSCKRTKDLAIHADPPTKPGYSYKSAKPGDMINPIDMWSSDPDQMSYNPPPVKDWEEDGDYIFHNLEFPSLEYGFDNEDVSDYGPKLAEAMAYHMAGAIGKKVTGSD